MGEKIVNAFHTTSIKQKKFKMHLPHQCPICKNKKFTKVLDAYFANKFEININNYKNEVVTVHFCSNCGHLFVLMGTLYNSLKVIKTYPLSTPEEFFSPEIQNISPNFIKIFNQSNSALEKDLTSIAGMGYRRALEFLIKDYLIKQFPKEKENIKKELLSESINRINDNRIKTLASRATWLGNDYTHYVNKHPEYSINSLKQFIKAITVYITAEICLKQAIQIKHS